MIRLVTHDFETKSYADLKKVGAWAYSEDPTTEVICLCYAIDDGEIQEWWPGKNPTDDMPADLSAARVSGFEFEAHNVAFEISIWFNIMAKRYGWKLPAMDCWRDSMAVACYLALPAALDRLGRVLGLEGKDPEGGRLITKYSKLHLKTAKAIIPPEDFRKFVNYCRGDVEQERQIGNIIGVLPEPELQIFLRDLETNMRGLYLDQEGIDNATAIVEQREEELKLRFNKIVGCNPGQNAKVIAWAAEQGVELENLQAEYLGDLLEEGNIGQGPLRDAIQIRLAINKASTKKLDAMSRQRGSDGRARFQTRYHGTMTGRNTGSGFQPLNLNRGYDVPDDQKDTFPEQLTHDMSYRDPKFLDMIYGDAMEAVSKAGRYWVQAQPGNRILAGDFVSIEAVLLACLAKEDWKIEAFRNKVKIYEMMADKIYNLPPGTVTKKTHPAERQDGKTGELAFGYQGALNAWLKFDSSGRHSDERIIEICKAWRAEHPATTQLWRDLEEAAIQALKNAGERIHVPTPNVYFQTIDCWLTMALPNGKKLWYFDPQLRVGPPPWHKPELLLDKDGNPNPCREKTCNCGVRAFVTYMAQKEGQWRRVSSYGGKWAENLTQAVSREVLEVAKRNIKKAGYPIIITVYDEIVTEPALGFGSKEEFEVIMRESYEGWYRNWPIGVDVIEGDRYRK